MAKLLKQLPALGQGVPAKPLSELDFLDLLGQPAVSPNPLPGPVVESVPSASSVEAGEVVNTVGNTSITGNPSLDTLDSVEAGEVASTKGKTSVTGNSLPLDTSDNSSNTTSQGSIKRSQVISNSGNTGNGINPGKSSKKDKPSKPVLLTSPVEPTVAADAGDVRQTLILSKSHFEQLRDLVHARRTAGDYAYSQKQAVREALNLLFAANGIAAPRSDEARERERQHRELIRKGHQLRAAKELPPSSGSVDWEE